MESFKGSEARIQAALNDVYALPLPNVVQELADRLGLKLTALVAGKIDTRCVQRWISGQKPSEGDALRAALQATRAIAERYDNNAARAWFRSTNSRFDLRAPILVLRDIRTRHDYDRFVQCALLDVS